MKKLNITVAQVARTKNATFNQKPKTKNQKPIATGASNGD